MVLAPEMPLFDFTRSHRVQTASTRSEVTEFFQSQREYKTELLLLNDTNPMFALSARETVKNALDDSGIFVVCFTGFMDETAARADLVFPVRLPLESWDEYGGRQGLVSTLQPTMSSLFRGPGSGRRIFEGHLAGARDRRRIFKEYLAARLISSGHIQTEEDWTRMIRRGGLFGRAEGEETRQAPRLADKTSDRVAALFRAKSPDIPAGPVFIAAPTLRLFDGRGANKSWLNEIPDPLTKVAWQNPVRMHPETAEKAGLAQEDLVALETAHGSLEAVVYASHDVMPGTLVMDIGQGHSGYGRYAENKGADPGVLLPPDPAAGFGGPRLLVGNVSLYKTEARRVLAHTDGSRYQFGRKIALSVPLDQIEREKAPEKHGLTMDTFPLTLPLPEAYHPERDIYPSHVHDGYRWGMVVDLDRCIGCAACAAACYAENNLAVVGEERMIQGREMAWLQVQRYLDPVRRDKVVFLPVMCQHCDNAPCESVCPVYAPHHSPEGLNNQVYNRCIGTRFCAQNCPYKVRRFNWFNYKWPEPLNAQLNPDVTVRSKGVMEKCSFCVQRIKEAHGTAKNEARRIRDGEIAPACVQTCPTGALIFGDFADENSRVRRLAADRRAYQVLGYLNTKPAVIYLQKVLQEI